MGGLRLREVRIRGFKAFNKEAVFDLNYDIIMLVGPVGSGKSSVLEAVEFALYGTTAEVRAGRLMKVDDLINDFSDEAVVVVKMVDEEGKEYEIVRSKRRGKRGLLRLIVNGEVHEEESQSKLEELLGLDYDSFSRHVFVRHEVLNALIRGPPLRRSEAIDKLLGIEALEQCFRAISTRLVEERIRELEEELSMIEAMYGVRAADVPKLKAELKRIAEEERRLEGEVKDLERRLLALGEERKRYLELRDELSKYETLAEHLEEEIEGVKYDENELRGELRELVEDIIESLEEALLHEEAGRLRRAMDQDLRELLEALRKAVEALRWEEDRLRKEVLELNEELLSYKGSYERIRSRLREVEREIERLRPLANEYENLLRRYGGSGELEKRMRRLEDEREELERGLKLVEERIDLINKVLGELALGKEVRCPVCYRELGGEDVRRLNELVKELTSSEYIKLKKVLERTASEAKDCEKVKIRLEELSNKLKNYTDLLSEREKLKGEESSYLDLIEEEEEKIEELRERLDRLRDVIARAETALTKYEHYPLFEERMRRLREYRAKVEELREKLRSVEFDERTYKELATLKEELDRRLVALRVRKEELEKELRRIEGTSERVSELRDKLKRLEELKARLIKVKNGLREVQRLVRERALKDLTHNMNMVFKEIYAHPDYTSLKIEVKRAKTEEGYERSVYNILAKRASDGTWVPVYSKLSDGQKVIVALSLVLSLFRIASRNFSTIILDEPVPNVDNECKEAILRSLTKLRGVRQIILATQDERFKEVKGPGSRVTYSLKQGGKEGPIIEVDKHQQGSDPWKGS